MENIFIFNFFFHSVSYEEALAYKELRRILAPALYNEKRQFEEPIPKLTPNYQSTNDRNRLPDISSIEEACVVEHSSDPANFDNNENVNADQSVNGFTQENPNVIATVEVASQSLGVLSNNDESSVDPLAEDVCVKEEEIEFAIVDPKDLDEIRTLLEDDNDARADDIEKITSATNTSNEDVIFLPVESANGFPKPIGELRSGILKREDDEISGNLCFQQTVRNAEFYYYLFEFTNGV